MDQEQFIITKAELIGECLKCGQPATGSFNCEEVTNRSDLTVECVNCHQKYSVRLDSQIINGWQDEIN